jgi:RNA polymerase sigma-70 factor (ECF subfamily)
MHLSPADGLVADDAPIALPTQTRPDRTTRSAHPADRPIQIPVVQMADGARCTDDHALTSDAVTAPAPTNAPAVVPLVAATDADLIQRYQAGDERAATVLVNRHADAVGRYAASLGTRVEVDILVQDTFVRAFRAMKDFRGESSLRTWLCAIAGRLVADRRRAARTARQTVSVDDDTLATHVTPIERLIADETHERLIAAVATLPNLQRRVFLLRAMKGDEYEEIALELGTTPGAARVHYHHAVKRLREIAVG